MKIWREKPGVISEGACWVALHGSYLYTFSRQWGQ